MPAASPHTRRAHRTSRRVRLVRRRVLAVTLVLVVGASIATFALPRPSDGEAEAPPSPSATSPAPTPTAAPTPASPAPTSPAPAPTSPAVCDDPAVVDALASGTDAEVVAALGGGEAFRAAVASGEAPCIDVTEAGRTWVVVNKRNALDPLDYWPTPQAQPQGIRVVSGGGWLRADAADALDELAAAIVADGVGTLGVDSAFRPYAYQVDLYNGYVASRGRAAADLRSARPGHSEHQTGLAVDVVACDGGCGSHDGFKGTAEAEWLVDNAWRFGFIIRYEDGATATTGYSWEPWHLRYIGVELAEAYDAGGYGTLEDFFGLPAAPDYDA
ncbi:M15 family metallopeptidase [Microbacterium sp. PA5]|uniref:M15 family metallopeptidase n=1 Tax=Microbacterium sp. PA5 TaxID=3416654 RepID=UPI003CE9EB2F